MLTFPRLQSGTYFRLDSKGNFVQAGPQYPRCPIDKWWWFMTSVFVTLLGIRHRGTFPIQDEVELREALDEEDTDEETLQIEEWARVRYAPLRD